VVINALEPEHSTCRWCERGDLNSVDSWFRSRFASKDPEALEPILGATTALALLGTLGVQLASDLEADADGGAIAVDALIVAEALSVALALTATAKVAFARQRPYALDVPETQVA